MTKTITQKILFKNTSPADVYPLYMDAKLHAKLTGAPARISSKAGSQFSAHGNYIKGKNLLIIKNKMIVQTWRGSDWNKTDGDSIFMLSFEPKGKDTLVQMTHANIPDKEADGIRSGWNDYYWKPWKEHLQIQRSDSGKAKKKIKLY
jgi:activator of HSP90 ATPase